MIHAYRNCILSRTKTSGAWPLSPSPRSRSRCFSACANRTARSSSRTKIEKITFQLARLKAWKLGAKTEATNAKQKRLLEETLVEDEASLQAKLGQARGQASPPLGPTATTSASPVASLCPIICAALSTTTSPTKRIAPEHQSRASLDCRTLPESRRSRRVLNQDLSSNTVTECSLGAPLSHRR